MNKKHLAALVVALAGVGGGASAQTFVSADVTTNTTWGGAANPSPIILENPIFVKNGAILTILPGTDVRGQPRTAAVVAGSTVGTPGTLIVTQNGRIIADGSTALPIVMTTAATDNNDNGIADDLDQDGFRDAYPGFLPGPGGTDCAPSCTPATTGQALFLDDTPRSAPLAPLDKAGNSNVALWGGLVVLGHAPTNNAEKCGVGYGKCTIEGLTVPGFPPDDATYGGVLPHDNSGSLRFVSIRHAGDEIGSGNELNGLSLGAVGSGTRIENVEVYVNFDDGFEWFGGTVNGKNLAVFFVGDDMFDLDEGYTGVNQFLFGVMPFFNENDGGAFGSASGDKAGEFDGDNYRPDNTALNGNANVRINADNTVVDGTPWPLSHPAMYNMTVIGTTPNAGQEFTPVSAAGTNRGIQFRNGFAGDVFNSIVVNTGAETGIELDTTTGKSPTGFDAIDNANNDLIALVCSTLDDGAAPAAQETTVINTGNDLNTSLGGGSGGNNVVNDVPSVFSGLVKEDQTFDPTGNTAGKLVAALKSSPINPRPNLTGGIAGCPAPQNPGVDRSATYRGAFVRTAPTLWTTGWTSMSLGGLLAN
jgi:hypothetical protein